MASDSEPRSLTFNESSLRLFQFYTGITDEAKLREHILDVQQRAIEVWFAQLFYFLETSPFFPIARALLSGLSLSMHPQLPFCNSANERESVLYDGARYFEILKGTAQVP